MIVWDVALRCNIGTNHGKSMVWLCIQRRMADLGRILRRFGSVRIALRISIVPL